MQKYFGEIALTITAIIWGSGFVASAIALDHFTPYQILAGRFILGTLILGVIFHKKLKNIDKSTMIKGAVLGIFLYLAFALQTVGLQYTTPSKNAFLTAVNVVIVPFIAFVMYKRKIDMYELVGAILAMIGVGVLSLKLSADINIGDLLTLGCAFGFAFHIFYTAKYVKDSDPILLTLIQMITAAIIGSIVVVLKGETSVVMEKEGLFSLLYLGVFSTTIAYLLQTVAQKMITETKAAMTIKMVLGAILILGAIIISETKLPFLKKNRLKEIRNWITAR
jgi:drug/metabolite transporter (DMT)-like permease